MSQSTGSNSDLDEFIDLLELLKKNIKLLTTAFLIFLSVGVARHISNPIVSGRDRYCGSYLVEMGVTLENRHMYDNMTEVKHLLKTKFDVSLLEIGNRLLDVKACSSESKKAALILLSSREFLLERHALLSSRLENFVPTKIVSEENPRLAKRPNIIKLLFIRFVRIVFFALTCSVGLLGLKEFFTRLLEVMRRRLS